MVDRANFRKLKKEKVERNKAYMQSIIPHDGYEFQFSKQDYPLDKVKIRIELRDMFFTAQFKKVFFL